MMDIAGTARRNWLYKLAALAIAILLWVYVNAEQQGIQTFPVQLDREGLEAGYVLDPEPPTVVELRVKGPKAIMANLSSRDFRARITLTGAKPGPMTVGVTVDAPPNVQIISKTPAELSLNVDVLETKTLPLTWEFKGNIPAGYRVGDPTLRPTEVVISGPREKLRLIQRVGVQIPMGAKETFTRSLPVRVIEPALGDDGRLQVTPKATEVTVPVNQEMTTKNVAVQPLVTGTPAAGYKVVSTRVEPANLPVSLPAEGFADIRALATSPVDINGARSDVVKEVNLALPAGVRPVNPALSVVRVFVAIGPAAPPSEPTPPPDESKATTGGGTAAEPGKEPGKEPGGGGAGSGGGTGGSTTGGNSTGGAAGGATGGSGTPR
ncbi:hypothetical protein GTO89_02715 [Heliobacterium gestii]|uniref:YbbR-like domain-containing protein n=1 Tax=Heliomicrobium gestii TaxID=2699 RepID=A0A845LGG2_HELGE|nr:CdaR family protein [Heliomicrobium gestii]MBM7865697.1 YbbR domain-containing protein [Heliomicrobium gestii]MZP41946.1 hypothetical protein [Heliomicrobium gestii]